MKRAAIVAGFILVLICASVLIFQRWARATLARLDATSRAEVAAELTRIGAAPRRPIVGAPRDADAAPEYIAALQDYGRKTKTSGGAGAPGLIALAQAAPAPLGAAATAALAACRAEIDRAREATRCERCVWQPFAGPDDPRVSASSLVEELGALMILDGHERLLAGDPAGAAERYFEAIAFGIDFATDAPTYHMDGALRLARAGAEALARVPHDGAAAAALARAVPSSVTAARLHRITLQRHFAEVARDGARATLLGRGHFAIIAKQFDETGRAIEDAYAIDDRTARAARIGEVTERAVEGFFRVSPEIAPGLRDSEEELRAALARLGSPAK